jgi:hypothetical protein
MKELVAGFRNEIKKISKAALGGLAAHIKDAVVSDYTKRVQQNHYPLRNPMTKKEMDSMPPKDIAKYVTKTVMVEKAIVYVPQKTEADKSGRMQELYGGKPWQKIRTNMQNLDYVNRILSQQGLEGLKAIPKI